MKRIVLFLFLVFGILNAKLTDIQRNILSNIKFYNYKLLDVVIKRQKIYKKLISNYNLTSEEATYYILHQPVNFDLKGALKDASVEVFEDLFVEQSKNAFDVSKVLFLNKFKEVKNLDNYITLLDMNFNLYDSIKATKNIKNDINNLIHDPSLINISQFLNDMATIVEWLQKNPKFVEAADQDKDLDKMSKLTTFLKDFSKASNEYAQYDQFKKNQQKVFDELDILNVQKNNGLFLTSLEKNFIKTYYNNILYSQLVIDTYITFADFINIFSKKDGDVFETTSDYIKAFTVGLKFLPAYLFKGKVKFVPTCVLAASLPTYNQKVSTYLRNMQSILNKPLSEFIDRKLIEKYKNDRDLLAKLLERYINGQTLSKNEIYTLINLWKLFNGSYDDTFFTFQIKRNNKKHIGWFLNKYNPIIVSNNEEITLPYIGDIYNYTPDKQYYISIWGKNYNVTNSLLSNYDIAGGGDNYKNIMLAEIGGNEFSDIKFKFNKENAFYNKDNDYYYYKFMIYEYENGRKIPVYNFVRINNQFYTRGNFYIVPDDCSYYINDNYGEIVFFPIKRISDDQRLTKRINNNKTVQSLYGKEGIDFLKNTYNSAYLYNSQFTYKDITSFYYFVLNHLPSKNINITLLEFKNIFPEKNGKYTIKDMYIIINNLLSLYEKKLINKNQKNNITPSEKNIYFNLLKLHHLINNKPIIRDTQMNIILYLKKFSIVKLNDKEQLSNVLTKAIFVKHLVHLFFILDSMKGVENVIK